MKKSQKRADETIAKLEEALGRILAGEPINISPDRKISIAAIEKEAGLGNGTAYYHKDFIERVKKNKGIYCQDSNNPKPKVVNTKEKLKNEKRLKNKYRNEVKQLKQKLSILASQLHQYSDALTNALLQNKILEKELKDEKTNKVISIK